MNYLDREYILTTSQPSPNPVVAQPITVWIPVISAAVGSLITVVVGGVFVKLWWDLKATESRALQAEKERDIVKIDSQYKSDIKEKELEIRDVKSQYEDRVRDITAEKDAEIRGKDFEIANIRAEVARLTLETPQRIKDQYESLRLSILQLNERLEKERDEAVAALIEKECEFKKLAEVDPNDPLLKEINAQKQELAIKRETVEDYLGIINSFRKRMLFYQAASTWINTNFQELADSAAKFVLQNNSQWLQGFPVSEKIERTDKLKANIQDYLHWIDFSLKRGGPVSLSEIGLQPEVPGFLLKEAFKFIQRERVARELIDNIAGEITPFVNDLVAYFSSSAFR